MPPIEQAQRMIEALDIAVFQVKSQSTLNDRTSFLRVQNFARSRLGSYIYLEVGSHIGGSLFPHLVDPACKAAISVDPRPITQPDERARLFHYSKNSTARMIAVLSELLLPDELTKLSTMDSDVSKVRPSSIKHKATLALIDGEHTNTACFSDFLGVLPLMKPDCIISFHDSNLIADAIRNAERFLDHTGIAHETAFLPDTVAVMGLGNLANAVREEFAPHAIERGAFLETSRQQLWSQIAQIHSPKTEVEVEGLRFRISELVEEIDRERKTGRDAEARLAALTSSTTWRASAPARALADSIKRRFRSRSSHK